MTGRKGTRGPVHDRGRRLGLVECAGVRGRAGRACACGSGTDPEWVAPEHWKAEVFSVLRGPTLGQKIDSAVGERGFSRMPRLGVETVPLETLLTRMWQLRDSISGYDAAYVVLAEMRDLTLVTGDRNSPRRLRRSAESS